MAFEDSYRRDLRKLRLDTSNDNTLRRFTDISSLPASFQYPYAPDHLRNGETRTAHETEFNDPAALSVQGHGLGINAGQSDLPHSSAIDIKRQAVDHASQIAQAPEPESDSIIFNSHVRLDDGNQRPIGETLPPRSRGARGDRGEGRSILQELVTKPTDDSSFPAGVEDDGASAVPPNDSTSLNNVDASLLTPISQAERYDQISSLASNPVATTQLESQPISPMYGNKELNFSPIATSSPVGPFPSLSGSGVPNSPRSIDGRRSQSYHLERNGSLRRFSRRSSTRSVASAKSPASLFLSKWGRDTPVAPVPDDEGQAIGDHGEYILGRQVGYGGFSTVKEVSTIENNEQVKRAVKIVRKQIGGRSEDDNERLQNEFEHEVYIWRQLNHPHVSPLLAVFNDSHATWCITTLNVGGTLWDLVKSHRKANFTTTHDNPEDADLITEPVRYTGILLHVARRYIRQLAAALQYLHQDLHIVHRDVKLENCLLDMSGTSSDGWGTLQLCDFGLADFVNYDARDDFENEKMMSEGESNSPGGLPDTTTSVVGSLQYASPEVIKSKKPCYQMSSDVWAFGVVCYALLASDLPFSHSLLPKVQMMILEGDWNRQKLTDAMEAQRDTALPCDLEAATKLVCQCLCLDVPSRCTISDVLNTGLLKETEG
ncbi:MAG: hypothetical protein M1828_001205 [Chrysothrix sp. TS-e1954]|nr:MAG: hypothetical protein M1828_001205 [Chrysothrix sp. TS-e1954]